MKKTFCEIPDLLQPVPARAGAPQLLLLDAARALLNGSAAVPELPRRFAGKIGERVEAGKFLVVACGTPGTDERAFWEAAGAAAVDAMRALRIESASLAGALRAKSPDGAASAFAVGAQLAAYRCVAYRSLPPKDHFDVKALHLSRELWAASARGRELGASINWARALVDAPANLLTPQTFAAQVQALKKLGVAVEVLDEKALKRIGAGGLLAVGGSSQHPPCLAVLRWNGRRGKDVDLGLAGKGLTFDAGGLNLKPAPGIAKMKFDMAGAAAVAGALRTLALRKAPLNVVGVLALCENVIDGSAYRPGDVITSLDGLTIEVDNTDAEGRIVLADALTYLAREHAPGTIVDLATLTGSIMAALHEEFAGLFTADDGLAAQLQDAAAASGDALWRMPLTPRQDYIVDSEIADVKNVGAPGFMGGGMGSPIAGAKFLERFMKGRRWAHLDIAGMAWSTRPLPGIPKGPTGYGVRLIDRLADRLGEKR